MNSNTYFVVKQFKQKRDHALFSNINSPLLLDSNCLNIFPNQFSSPHITPFFLDHRLISGFLNRKIANKFVKADIRCQFKKSRKILLVCEWRYFCNWGFYITLYLASDDIQCGGGRCCISKVDDWVARYWRQMLPDSPVPPNNHCAIGSKYFWSFILKPPI